MTIRAHWGHLTRGNITILRVFGILICPSIEITKVSKPCTLGTQKDADGVGTPLWALLVTVGTFLVAFDFEQLEQLSSIALTHSPTHTHTHALTQEHKQINQMLNWMGSKSVTEVGFDKLWTRTNCKHIQWWLSPIDVRPNDACSHWPTASRLWCRKWILIITNTVNGTWSRFSMIYLLKLLLLLCLWQDKGTVNTFWPRSFQSAEDCIVTFRCLITSTHLFGTLPYGLH